MYVLIYALILLIYNVKITKVRLFCSAVGKVTGVSVIYQSRMIYFKDMLSIITVLIEMVKGVSERVG